MALAKQDIVKQIQASLGFPKNKSVDIAETRLAIIKSTMASGDDFRVSGFGKFCVKEKKREKAATRLPVKMRFYQRDVW